MRLRPLKIARFEVTLFLVAMSGTMHPVFTLLAFVVFGSGLIRHFRQKGIRHLRYWLDSLISFAITYIVLASYYTLNFAEYQNQVGGRAGILSTNLLGPLQFIWENLLFWTDPLGIEFGLYGLYPAFVFTSIMLLSTWLVVRNRSELWADDHRWITLPMVFAQWAVFFVLPTYVPSLAFSSFIASLTVVTLVDESHFGFFQDRKRILVFAGACTALSLLFITVHVVKFVV